MKSFEFLREADDTDRYKMYTIQRGDTLSKLAPQFDTTVKGLMYLNPQITNPDLIITGNTLRVPKTGGGTVQPPVPKPKTKPVVPLAVDSDDIDDVERAWLNMISGKESGDDYNILNFRARALIKAGRLKTSGGPGEHPFANGYLVDGKPVPKEKRFTAAGRYQFVISTWKQAAALAGVDPSDFSPENQDRAAIALAKDAYQLKYPNRDLVADLQDPKRVDQAIQGSTGPWSLKAGGPGFNGNDYIAALDDLGRQTALPKAKR
jgi:muramidase (phage lysozyme)